MAKPTVKPAATPDGSAIYSSRNLKVYDWWVLGFSNRFAWRCPTRQLREHFLEHATSNHLDIGAGTGYYLARCMVHGPGKNATRIALMDSSLPALQFAAKRIRNLNPELIHQDVLAPASTTTKRFDSVSMNYLLHCLPGTMRDKARSFDTAASLMNPGSVIFGATILGNEASANQLARCLNHFYRKKKIFHNQHDDTSSLLRELERRFDNVTINLVGHVALFAARLPKETQPAGQPAKSQ